jgi:uncharacterized repeat protein (TIGR03803 family)
MSRNRKRLSTLGAVMLVVIIVIPVLSPGARAASNYKTLHKFTGGGLEESFAGLVFDQAGNLYGTTSGGGVGLSKCGYSAGCGTVFKLTPNADGNWRESVLYSFCSRTNCGDGEIPIAGLTFDQAGNLYGMTDGGGATGGGTAFKLTPHSDGSWTESVLYSFCNHPDHCAVGVGSGRLPLIFDTAGNLYGTTILGGYSGQGTVFKLTPHSDGSWTQSVLHEFTGEDGSQPLGVIFDTAGNLYGSAAFGGVGGSGTVFKLMPQSDGSWTESVLYRFTGMDGSQPNSVILDAAGNLYGTAGGGNFSQCDGNGCGLAFQLTPNADGSWKEKVLHHFTGVPDGGWPGAGMIFDQMGNLYGTTTGGGKLNCSPIGCGVVFKLAPNSKGGWNEIVLHTFADHPGANPNAGLILDPAGNLYGTTEGDLSTTFGSVFEITP